MKKLLASLLLPALFLLCGCARTLVVEEVLQVSVNSRLFTACNIWYEDPESVSCENTLRGRILPFGTEVRILSATDRKIVFRPEGSKQDFTLCYDESIRMMTPENYLRTIFTTESRDALSEGIAPTNVEKILRGVVEKGMSKKEVRLAYGPPCKYKTPDEKLDTWLYWTSFIAGKRVVFNNDRVVDIIVLE